MKLFGMKPKSFLPAACSLLAVALLFTACSTPADPKFTSAPELGIQDGGKLPATTGTVVDPTAKPSPDRSGLERLHQGDQISVIFSGIEPAPQPHVERIKEDGTITLPLIGAVKAVDRSPGEVQKEIHDLYVPKYYVRLTVTVTPADRYFFVSGEVKGPGRQVYAGETTVTKAIASAGDFTDWANKKKVKLTRADGTSITVNVLKANEDPTADPVVFPGDKIHVPRKSPWSP